MICRVVCWLHAGEMLGESRLMMDTESIRPGAVPMRTATVVAEGHMVLLSMTTAEARACFDADRLAGMRHLAAARQDILASRSSVVCPSLALFHEKLCPRTIHCALHAQHAIAVDVLDIHI